MSNTFIEYQTIESNLTHKTDRQFANWINSLSPQTIIESSPLQAAPGSVQHVPKETWGRIKRHEHIDKFQKAVLTAFPPNKEAVLISTLRTTHIRDRMSPDSAHSLVPWSRRGVSSLIHEVNPMHPLEHGLAILQMFISG